MRRFSQFLPVMAALAAVAILATPPPARADFKVELSFGGAVITLDDTTSTTTTSGGASTAGATITYGANKITVTGLTVSPTGTSGGFTLNATIATSNTPGDQFVAKISESGLDIMNQSGATGTLQIRTTSTGFNLPNPASGIGLLKSTVSASADAANTASATVTFNSYSDNNNVEFGTQNGTPTIIIPGLNSTGDLNPGDSGSGNSHKDVPVVTPFSLSQTELITLAAGDDLFDGSSGTSLVTPAPPGLALALAGLPFVAVGWLRRRRKAVVA